MTTLLVGFDAAWTLNNSDAIVGMFCVCDETFEDLGPPQIADYRKAEEVIVNWQREKKPTATIVLLDQPTIVKNSAGQRPVENIVSASVGLRCGGMFPANTARMEMFGKEAPVWQFLSRFGGPANPLEPVAGAGVFETYPVLAMIALGWTLPDSRRVDRLPKYNPALKKTFSISDWQYVCKRASRAFCDLRLKDSDIVRWINDASKKTLPRKRDQDGLDACVCLLVALYLAERKCGLMVGDRQSGYIVVPYSAGLHAELDARCKETDRVPSEWVKGFPLRASAP